MNKQLLMFPIIFITVGGCSGSDDTASQQSSNEAVSGAEKAAPTKVAPSNPFSTQINALDTAKMVGKAAQKSIDTNQQKLEDARDN